MNTVLVVLLFASAAALVVSSDPLDLCRKRVPEIASTMRCIRLKTTVSFRTLLHKFLVRMRCPDDVCFVQAWCRKNHNDFKGQAFKSMPYKYFLEFFNAAKKCQSRIHVAERSVSSELWRHFVKMMSALLI
ncbi:antimicrobial peptide microplusin-like [Dermacentor albipictus]|uniref:antimicrobial peptide microplusin-like n=1 Tax=Dermacentor albipictus TaxID=60249 RepID=UPI0031FD3724